MRIITIIPVLLIFTGACEKVDEFTHFTMNYNSQVTIESSTVIDVPIQLQTPEIESNSESKFEVNDTRKDLIEEIKLQEAKLTISEPSEGDFGFLNDISLYINAGGLDEQFIAGKEDIPDDIGADLQLDVKNIDIQEYIKKMNFYLKLKQ
jgi:hypothetical protein